MDITTNDIQAIPYSHHYRCFPQMVGSVANQAVFMYLMDEYICRLRTGKPTEFKVSVNEIAQKRNMNRRTVSKCIDDLETMGLLCIADNQCTIYGDRYISLIKTFHNLSKTDDKTQFINALQEGDYGYLKRLGYEECGGIKSQLTQQSGNVDNLGGLVQKCTTQDDSCAKMHNVSEGDLCKNAQPDNESCVKMHNLDGGLCKNAQLEEGGCVKMHRSNSELCKNAQYDHETCAKMHNLDERLCKNAQPDSPLVQKYTTLLDEIRQEVLESYSKMAFIGEFYPELSAFLGENELENVLKMLFDEEAGSCVFGLEIAMFLHFWGCAKMHKGVCKNAQLPVQKCTTVNKEINKNKKESTRNFVPGEKEETKDDFFELDREGLDKSISSYRNIKKKRQLPFFPVNEVQEYISDIRNCLDRADKIFINQVWEILHECFDQEAILDEDGNEQLPASNEIENIGVPKERLMKDILFPAFDKTQEIIETGKITVMGEEFPVTATIDNPEDFGNIVDWELQTLLDGDNYIISSKRIRNIFGDQVEQVSPRSVKREGREDDMSYMQKIILLGDDDNKYSQLTPIELVAYNFLNEHFQIGEHETVEEPKHGFANRTSLRTFYVDAREKGVTEQDFLSILSNDKPDGTGSLNLRQRMFSAEKIRNWNRLHTVSSIVDEFKLPTNE